jgi:hypothetical protein
VSERLGRGASLWVAPLKIKRKLSQTISSNIIQMDNSFPFFLFIFHFSFLIINLSEFGKYEVTEPAEIIESVHVNEFVK